MNRELLTWFRALNPEQLNALRLRFREAPVQARMLDFLQACKDETFTTQAAVLYIYVSESETQPFPKLRNRFFKLRKELLTYEQQHLREQQSDAEILSPEESEFYQLRLRVHSKHADTALRGLKVLAQNCRLNNHFELYPQVLRELIFGLLLSELHPRSEKIFAELEKANKLQNAWNKMFLFYRSAYYAHEQSSHYDDIQQILKKMRSLSIQFKEWPRFTLAYLFACITFETSRAAISTQVISRYFKQLERLLSLHPDMPVFYIGPAHRLNTLYQVEHLRVMFNFQTGNFEQAYSSLLLNWNRLISGAINRPISEKEFRNRIKIELSTGRFQDALHTVKDLISFQKTTGLSDNILLSYQEMALIYIYAHPVLVPDKPAHLLKYLELRLRQVAQATGKKNRTYAEILSIKAAFLLIIRKFDEALLCISEPEIQEYYSPQLYTTVKQLYLLPGILKSLNKEKAKAELVAFEDYIRHQLSQAHEQNYQQVLGFILKISRTLFADSGTI